MRSCPPPIPIKTNREHMPPNCLGSSSYIHVYVPHIPSNVIRYWILFVYYTECMYSDSCEPLKIEESQYTIATCSEYENTNVPGSSMLMKFWSHSWNSVNRLEISLFFSPRFPAWLAVCRLEIDTDIDQVRTIGIMEITVRRSSGGPIGVGGALVVPGLCWETRTSLYRLRWRRRVVPGSRLGRHQPRHGGRRRWRYSAKLRI